MSTMTTPGRSTPPASPTAGRVIIYKPQGHPERAEARARARKVIRLALAVAIPLSLVLLWELAARNGAIDERLFPAPSTIVETGYRMFVDGQMWNPVGLTLKRVLLGGGIGILTGALTGAAMGLNATARAALEPMLSALYVIPKIALLPVFITAFGLGETPLLVIIAVTVFFYVWIYTMEAFASIPEGYLEAGQSLNLSRWRMFSMVLLPAALPAVFVALRVAITVSIIVIVASEYLVGAHGLGYLIFNARQLFMNDQMYVGIVTVSLLGVLLVTIVRWIGKLVTPWVKYSVRRTD
jgi:sulfonate transport system permease protein